MLTMPAHLPARSPAPKRAFTLIELLTVIAIIGILAAIIIPTVGAVRNKAKTLQCTAKLREWGKVVRLFANDSKGNIPLLINLSGDAPLQFYNGYFPKGKDFDNSSASTVQAVDFWTVCPTVTRTVSDEANRRYYNFLSPNGAGKKTAPSGTNAFGTGAIGKSVEYYNLTSASSPSRLILMMEQLPGSDAPIRGSAYVPDFNTKILPIITNADKTLVRHNGVINVLYLDGSVRTRQRSEVEFLPTGGTTITTDPRFNL